MTGNDILHMAALWHARQDDDELDWQAFESWLAADPRHRRCYDDIALLDRRIDDSRDALGGLLPAPGVARVRRWRTHWWIAGGGSIIATIIFSVVAFRPGTGAAIFYRAANEPREVQLAGARITLAPGSSMTARRGGAGSITLNGRAIFAVESDADPERVIRAEGYDIRHVGARFEVVGGAGAVSVRVDEGMVAVSTEAGARAPVQVIAGRTATGFASGRIVTGPAGKAVLGGWRTGPIVYEAMPLGLVAADLARATGRPVVADDSIADRLFSGMLTPDDGPATLAALVETARLASRMEDGTTYLSDPGVP